MNSFPRKEGGSHVDKAVPEVFPKLICPLHDTTEGEPFFAVVPIVPSLWQTPCHLLLLLLALLARNRYLKSVLLPTSRP
jgi:hypothetical protein